MRSILHSVSRKFSVLKVQRVGINTKISLKIQRASIIFLLIVLLPVLGKNAFAQASNTYGGIEIGGKGVKATIVKLIPNENGYDAEMQWQSSINATIMAGVEQSGKFSDTAMQDAAKAVKQLYTEMQEKYQVSPEHIFIVGSSGLLANNKNELADRVKNLTGKSMDFITVETEIKLSIIGVVPEKYYQESLYLDIGSGNTKGGYRKGKSANDLSDENFVMVSVPYGTVSFTNAITKATETNPAQFEKQTKTLGKKLIATPIKKQAKEKSELKKRQRVYLTGGMIWAIATLMHPESRETFTKLTNSDIDRFYNLAVNKSETLLNPDLSKIADLKTREAVQQEVQRVKTTYTSQNLIAGAKILQSAARELKIKNKPIYFARYGQVAWLFSYVVQAANK
jgi:exopolyphosphatase/pppGpp-phosphohydrolase